MAVSAVNGNFIFADNLAGFDFFGDVFGLVAVNGDGIACIFANRNCIVSVAAEDFVFRSF